MNSQPVSDGRRLCVLVSDLYLTTCIRWVSFLSSQPVYHPEQAAAKPKAAPKKKIVDSEEEGGESDNSFMGDKMAKASKDDDVRLPYLSCPQSLKPYGSQWHRSLVAVQWLQ